MRELRISPPPECRCCSILRRTLAEIRLPVVKPNIFSAALRVVRSLRRWNIRLFLFAGNFKNYCDSVSVDDLFSTRKIYWVYSRDMPNLWRKVCYRTPKRYGDYAEKECRKRKLKLITVESWTVGAARQKLSVGFFSILRRILM